MKHANEQFHQGILAFIDANETIFNGLKTTYKKVESLLDKRLGKDPSQITMTDLESLKKLKDQRFILELGNYLVSLKKATKKKFVMEYTIEQLKLDPEFCHLSMRAFDFFHIKNQLGDLTKFKQLVSLYKTDKLDMDRLWRLKDMIGYWQCHFNNNHLRSFSKNLFGMTYKELKTVKEGCEKQTRSTYKTIRIDNDFFAESLKTLWG